MSEYKKNYKPLIVFFLAFISTIVIGVLIAAKLCPDNEMRVSMALLNAGAFTLTLIIYKTRYIYWYNGVSFEDAQNASEERRKAFALSYMKRFLIPVAIILIFIPISVIAGLPQWVDFIIGALSLIAVAISTVTVKL